MERTQLLADLGVVLPDRDLRHLDRSELATLFAAQSSGRIKMAPLIRSIIIQAHRSITSGEEAPIHGNIRTFYYRYVKPVLSHIHDDDSLRTDPYDTMIHVFRDLVLEHRLFRYQDFDFTDENWENRRIGDRRPATLIFTEKTGWVRFLREVHQRWGSSTLALGGAPSALTSEYTATALLDLINHREEVKLIGIVDFDPDGQLIARVFKKQLHAAGLRNIQLQTVINPQDYTETERKIFRFPLSRSSTQQSKIKRWLGETGGVDGEPFGLEAESLPIGRVWKRLETLFEEAG